MKMAAVFTFPRCGNLGFTKPCWRNVHHHQQCFIRFPLTPAMRSNFVPLNPSGRGDELSSIIKIHSQHSSLTNLRMFSNKSPLYQADSSAKKDTKPDLKRAAARDGPGGRIVVGCILATIFLYPMIFKPFFGIGSLGDKQSENIKSAGIDLEKFRPSFMPKWSSPFGPKNGDKDN